MDSGVKHVHHGTTVVVDSGAPQNPPPYTGPPGHPPPPPQIHVDATVVPAAIVVSAPMGPKPTTTTCRSCHAQIVTRVEHVSSTKTHLLAGLLCLLGCWCCVCIPYCSESCQNAEHYCPNCGSYIGSYTN